jgi:hypothetical protein
MKCAVVAVCVLALLAVASATRELKLDANIAGCASYG